MVKRINKLINKSFKKALKLKKTFVKQKLIITPKILFFGGLVIFLSFSLLNFKKNLSPLSPSPFPNPSPSLSIEAQYSLPAEINIPRFKLNLPVQPGGFKEDNWILLENAVMFLDTSGLPGEGYNTVLYGHNYLNLLQNLKYLKTGDQIIVKTQNEKEFVYEVRELKKAKPSEVWQLKSETPNTLTLFTCQGAFDQERLIVKALLKEKEP